MKKSKEQAETINDLILATSADTDYISNGIDTFGELYEQRAELAIVICRCAATKYNIWKCKISNDECLVGIHIKVDEDITFTLPMCKWNMVPALVVDAPISTSIPYSTDQLYQIQL